MAPTATTKRPSAQDFLELVERSKRGRLKLYLGFAAGVGKTWRMLEEAHALKRRGVDVVAGLVETHGRRETEVLTEGLEILPPGRYGKPRSFDEQRSFGLPCAEDHPSCLKRGIAAESAVHPEDLHLEPVVLHIDAGHKQQSLRRHDADRAEVRPDLIG